MNLDERKPKLIKSLLILLSVMVFIMGLSRHIIEGANTSQTIYFLYFVSIFFIGCYFYVSKYGKTKVVGFLIVTMGFLVTTIRMLNTSGLDGSAITWYVGIPAIAAFVQGHRWVLPWCAISVLGTSIPLLRPDLVSGETFVVVNFVVLSLLIIVNSLMMYIFEKQRIENEQRILEQSKFLAQSEKILSLSTLAGGIAHEINNPLAVIKGFSEQLRKKSLNKHQVTDAEIENTCTKIDNSVRRISAITQNLLVFTRAGQVDEFQVLCLGEIVESVKAKLENPLKDIKFTLLTAIS